MDIIVDRMKREFKVEATLGRPKWHIEKRYFQMLMITHKNKGGAGQFARVKLTVEPLDPEKKRN